MRVDDGSHEAREPGVLPVVGVMGSGEEEHAERAEPLGRALAGLGVHLLTGGGRGVMEAVGRAFAATQGRVGLSIGVLPALPGSEPPRPPPGYPNPHVELVLRTHLRARGRHGDAPDSRNHLNVLSADVVIALPGGAGTYSEVALALRYGRPVIVWGWHDAPAGAEAAKTLDEVLAFVRARLG